MPRSILQFSIWNLISYPENMCKQTESRPSFILSKASYGRFCIFSNRYIGHIPRKQIEKKHKLKKAGFQCVGWCMINIVPKNHTQIRTIERAMANPPLWQWLDGPARRTKNNSIEQLLKQMVLDGWRITKECIILHMLHFVLFLVIGCRDYLPVAFCTCAQSITHFICAYAIRQTPSSLYVYPTPVYWSRLHSFLTPEWCRGCVPHAFPRYD